MARRSRSDEKVAEKSLTLLQAYGSLLTRRQRALVEQHFRDGRSFADIARANSVSRQAIHDAVRKAMETLASYEARLGPRQPAADIPPALAETIRLRLDDLRKRIAGSGIIYRSDWIIRELSAVLEMLPASPSESRELRGE